MEYFSLNYNHMHELHVRTPRGYQTIVYFRSVVEKYRNSNVTKIIEHMQWENHMQSLKVTQSNQYHSLSYVVP